jgi:Sortase and related acyltransferases
LFAASVMTDILLRAARPGDIADIAHIYAHAVRHGTASFELDAPDAPEMLRRYRALVDRGYPYLVAQSGGEILGYAYAAAYRARPAYRWTIEDSIYVAPHAHRRGVGSALLRRLVEMSEAQGFRQMIAAIGDSANVSSIELHRALGFHMVGTLATLASSSDAGSTRCSCSVRSAREPRRRRESRSGRGRR